MFDTSRINQTVRSSSSNFAKPTHGVTPTPASVAEKNKLETPLANSRAGQQSMSGPSLADSVAGRETMNAPSLANSRAGRESMGDFSLAKSKAGKASMINKSAANSLAKKAINGVPNLIKGIIILNEEALEIIKLTLTPEESVFVEIKDGRIDVAKLREGVKLIGEDKLSNNYRSLLTIAEAEDVVEVLISETYMNQGGVQEFPKEIVNDYEDSWKFEFNGNDDLSGYIKIDGASFTFEEYKKYYQENNLGQGIYVSGTQGVTQIPDKFITNDFDKKAKEEALKAGGYSNNNLVNRRVTITKKGVEINKFNAVETMAHELYGHALMSILGKPALHGIQRSVDNPELENQIKTSVNEASKNAIKNGISKY